MQVRLLKIPDGAIRITERSEAPEGATIYEGDQGGLAYMPAGEGTGEDEGAGDKEQQVAEVAANAEPNQLAAGIPAAISAGRDDYTTVYFRVATANTNAEAQAILEDNLTQAEIDKLAEEVALQEQMRQEFDAVEDLEQLQFGQEVLADGDTPIRGVVDDVQKNTVFIANANKNSTVGVSIIEGNPILAEETQSKPDVEAVEPGLYGMASSDEVLSQPFDYATDVKGSREAGIMDGNTTGESMKVLTMEDGSKVFATPVDAYEDAGTGVVDGPEEAKINNINSPKVINRLRGNACKTELVEGPGGREYIAKEGVPGEKFIDGRRGPIGAGATNKHLQSTKDTLAAAYFVGNGDLHGANMKIDEDEELVIIDHDAANGFTINGEHNIDGHFRYDTPYKGTNEFDIFTNARNIKQGEIDFSDIGDAHTDYAHKAADKALRVAAMDDAYDLPPDETPEAMQMIEGFEDTDNWPETGDAITFVGKRGTISEGKIYDVPREGVLKIERGTGGFTATINENDINRIVEVL
jgi:hypothetical protein